MRVFLPSESSVNRTQSCLQAVFKKLIGLSTLVLAVLMVGCSTLGTTTGAAVDTAGAETSNRFETTLGNGLKVIAVEDNRAPIVMTQVWYQVGSVDEPTGKGGISHLLEHMMFKGTHKVSGEDFDKIVSRFGGSQNAFTSSDYTGYYQLYPAQQLALAVELEADRMTNLVLAKEDLQTERSVVMEERRERVDDNPDAQAYEALLGLAYPTAPMANPVIGSMSDLESITLEDLKNWYQQWYSPSNAVLVVVGSVDHEQVFALAEQYFGEAQAQTLPARSVLIEAPINQPRSSQITVDVPAPYFYLGFNVPSLGSAPLISDPAKAQDAENRAYQLALLTGVLDGGLSARLEKNLVREQQLLSQVSTSYDLFSRGDTLFLIRATPRAGVDLETAKAALWEQIESLKQPTITPAELARVKNDYLTGLIYAQDDVATQARLIGSINMIGQSDTLLSGLPQRLAKINSESLNQTAKEVFDPDKAFVFEVSPKSVKSDSMDKL